MGSESSDYSEQPEYVFFQSSSKHPLEQGMTTHSSILTWRIPWTEELGGLQSMGLKELGTTEWLTLSLSLPNIHWSVQRQDPFLKPPSRGVGSVLRLKAGSWVNYTWGEAWGRGRGEESVGGKIQITWDCLGPGSKPDRKGSVYIDSGKLHCEGRLRWAVKCLKSQPI